MGNCIKHPSSAVAFPETIAKPTETDAGSPYCDEQRTVESSTYASPPPSPVKAMKVPATLTEMEPDDDRTPLLEKNDGDSSLVEQHREEGQRRLRELVVTGATAGEFDWKSIIALAEDLHRKEQQLLRSYNGRGHRDEGSRKNTSRRQAFFEKRRRKKDEARRKKLESVGSFSVNLLAYDSDDHIPGTKGAGAVEKALENSLNSSTLTDATQDATLDESDDAHTLGVEDVGDTDEIDVFEDDDPSPLLDASYQPLSPRISLESPGTPQPIAKQSPPRIQAGSFMAATSLFGLVEEEEESSESESDDSSSSLEEAGETEWDLMTIDENATVSDW